jgi:hypothetical protein
MHSHWLLLCLFACLLGFPHRSCAQPASAWPRQAPTGRVAFTGIIPWPTATQTLAQQQVLVRRWYAQHLTSEKLPLMPAHATTADSTFAGLPNQAYLDSVSYSASSSGAVDSVANQVTWRLIYQVSLTPTPVGLAYRLSEFECVELVVDAINAEALEKVLPRYPAELAVFHRRLQRALVGW